MDFSSGQSCPLRPTFRAEWVLEVRLISRPAEDVRHSAQYGDKKKPPRFGVNCLPNQRAANDKPGNARRQTFEKFQALPWADYIYEARGNEREGGNEHGSIKNNI